MAVIICLGACIAIGRGAGLSYPAYAVFCCSPPRRAAGSLRFFAAGSGARGARSGAPPPAGGRAGGRGKLLEEAAERREEFIASFAHELKTPLTAIIGYADMLRSREMSPKNRFTAAGYIFSEGKRLEALSLKLMR